MVYILRNYEEDSDYGEEYTVHTYLDGVFLSGSGDTILEAIQNLEKDNLPYPILAKLDSIEEITTKHPELLI